jgi:hypothetical protein
MYISISVDPMPNTGIAKIFMHGRSQAVRLPWRSVCRAIACACVASKEASCLYRW